MYDEIINDPEFLDLLWRELSPDNKYNALMKYGFKLLEEYKKFKEDEIRI